MDTVLRRFIETWAPQAFHRKRLYSSTEQLWDTPCCAGYQFYSKVLSQLFTVSQNAFVIDSN